MARLHAARGVVDASEIAGLPADLIPPSALTDTGRAAKLLADAIDLGQTIVVIADYDCDGATACALMVRGLRMLGANADYLVPNRFVHGYGLTPEIATQAARHPRAGRPDWLITVDNGIASVEGVARASALGLRVIVTDHHLPGPELPAADAIVNPNRVDCGFPSKHLAGVGVAFYLMLALRAELRSRGRFGDAGGPPLQRLLDLVALGTVADLVRLDRNNRILVAAGLKRIRAAQANEGIRALLAVAGREPRSCSTGDLGFAVGPRVNAAGRLADITIGVECLLTDDPERAMQLAQQLDAINRERRAREAEMRDQAFDDVAGDTAPRCTRVVRRDSWHEGVVGLVASRLKERLHRPVFAFAPGSTGDGTWRGSGRSIPGIHLRDVLDLVSKRHPDLILRFGGHAMAAGLTLAGDRLDDFERAIEQVVAETADPDAFTAELHTDGPLAPEQMTLELIDRLGDAVWGQGYPEPLFADEFQIVQQRLVKDRHLKLTVRLAGRTLEGIYFDRTEPLAPRSLLAYRLTRNEFRGTASVQLQIVAAEAVAQEKPGIRTL
jgi:single-stranded-DNA-specific exonuclease